MSPSTLTALDEELGGQLERLERQLGLGVRILKPGGTHVGRAVVQDPVRAHRDRAQTG